MDEYTLAHQIDDDGDVSTVDSDSSGCVVVLSDDENNVNSDFEGDYNDVHVLDKLSPLAEYMRSKLSTEQQDLAFVGGMGEVELLYSDDDSSGVSDSDHDNDDDDDDDMFGELLKFRWWHAFCPSELPHWNVPRVYCMDMLECWVSASDHKKKLRRARPMFVQVLCVAVLFYALVGFAAFKNKWWFEVRGVSYVLGAFVLHQLTSVGCSLWYWWCWRNMYSSLCTLQVGVTEYRRAIKNALHTIMETEMVSRGYRLSSVTRTKWHAPVVRIENRSVHFQLCGWRRALAHSLHSTMSLILATEQSVSRRSIALVVPFHPQDSINNVASLGELRHMRDVVDNGWIEFVVRPIHKIVHQCQTQPTRQAMIDLRTLCVHVCSDAAHVEGVLNKPLSQVPVSSNGALSLHDKCTSVEVDRLYNAMRSCIARLVSRVHRENSDIAGMCTDYAFVERVLRECLCTTINLRTELEEQLEKEAHTDDAQDVVIEDSEHNNSDKDDNDGDDGPTDESATVKKEKTVFHGMGTMSECDNMPEHYELRPSEQTFATAIAMVMEMKSVLASRSTTTGVDVQ